MRFNRRVAHHDGAAFSVVLVNAKLLDIIGSSDLTKSKYLALQVSVYKLPEPCQSRTQLAHHGSPNQNDAPRGGPSDEHSASQCPTISVSKWDESEQKADLDGAGEHVSVMRTTGGKRRAVVERESNKCYISHTICSNERHALGQSLRQLERCLEGINLLPVLQNLRLRVGEAEALCEVSHKGGYEERATCLRLL